MTVPEVWPARMETPPAISLPQTKRLRLIIAIRKCPSLRTKSSNASGIQFSPDKEQNERADDRQDQPSRVK
jgi:hypothetical protein